MTDEKLRLDKYLWAIRLYKTRSAATDACTQGKVKLDGQSVKASRPVHVGETYEVKTEQKKWLIRVTALLDHRVQYSEAIRHYEDITPVEELERLARIFQQASPHSLVLLNEPLASTDHGAARALLIFQNPRATA